MAGLLTEPRWLGQETGHSHPGLLRGYEDFSEWAGHYKLKLKREAALEQWSRRRIEQLLLLSLCGDVIPASS